MTNRDSVKGRREFLRKGIIGLAGISLLPSPIRSENEVKYKIIYRMFGKTGIKLPIISVGCAHTDNTNIVRAALDTGLVLLDTAGNYYGGRNETMLGEVLKERPRHSFMIATKVDLGTDNRTGLYPESTNPKKFRYLFNQSLKRLKLGYVDILYQHRLAKAGAVAFGPIKDEMMALKKEGKVRFLGISTHQNEAEVIRATADQKIYDVILTSYNFRQPHNEEVKRSITYAAKAGLGVVVMKTRAGIYWDKGRKNPINWKAALKWIFQEKNIHTALCSFPTFDSMEDAISVMKDLTLTPQEKEDLRLKEKNAKTGLYCAQCGICRLQCRYNLEIPIIMRSYMYAYGYKDLAKAKETLLEKNLEEITCRLCNNCAVSCIMDFDVPKKIKDITRILDFPDEFLV